MTRETTDCLVAVEMFGQLTACEMLYYIPVIEGIILLCGWQKKTTQLQ